MGFLGLIKVRPRDEKDEETTKLLNVIANSWGGGRPVRGAPVKGGTKGCSRGEMAWVATDDGGAVLGPAG